LILLTQKGCVFCTTFKTAFDHLIRSTTTLNCVFHMGLLTRHRSLFKMLSIETITISVYQKQHYVSHQVIRSSTYSLHAYLTTRAK